MTWQRPDNVTRMVDCSIPNSWVRQFMTDVELDQRLFIPKVTTPANK